MRFNSLLEMRGRSSRSSVRWRRRFQFSIGDARICDVASIYMQHATSFNSLLEMLTPRMWYL